MGIKEIGDKVIEILMKYGITDKREAQKCFIEIINILQKR